MPNNSTKFLRMIYCITVFFIFLSTRHSLNAQFDNNNILIIGPEEVSLDPDRSIHYGLFGPGNINSTYWSTSFGAHIEYSTSYDANIVFTHPRVVTIYASSEDGFFNMYDAELQVTVEGATIPGTPTVQTPIRYCGFTRLVRNNPPPGITWYWQSSATGIDTSNSSSFVDRHEGTSYYIRGYNAATNEWGLSTTVTYSIKDKPETPPENSVTVISNCHSTVLSRIESPSAESWYWQSTSAGTTRDFTSAFPTINLTEGNIYYLRAFLGNGCWSDALAIHYTINNGTQMYYVDSDNDTYGDRNSTPQAYCSPPDGYVLNNDDYDDSTEHITNIPPQNFYEDADNDGLGDPNVMLYYSNQPTGYVTNANDQCPDINSPTNSCGSDFEVINAITSKSFDIDGTVKANSKIYYDDLGKPIQNQTVDIETGKTWASQTLYDVQGRPALQSLSAPINNSGDFLYKPDFIQKTNGTTYTTADFENNPENPSTVGTASNTLGNYYSTANDDADYPGNSYMDITSYPFSRTIFSTLNPGAPLQTIGGNKVDTDKDGDIDANDFWPQTYSFTMPASQELAQSVAFGESKYNSIKTLKTVSRDLHGVENVVFTDTDGKVLAAARSGSKGQNAPLTISMPKQGFVDIHIPEGVTGISTSNNNAVAIYSLIEDEKINTSFSALPNGFYRVAVKNLDTYIPNSISVTYTVNYYDYTLNEYDEADRLIASYQPLNKLKTEYQYNTRGELVYTKSPDEGEAWFKYRDDGQIRFSQNSKQVAAGEFGEFSYTNYDSYGRPIESGIVVTHFIPGSNNNVSFTNLDPDLDYNFSILKEVTYTQYDDLSQFYRNRLANIAGDYGNPTFLAGNVTRTRNNQAETFYSYDVYGRVKWLVQDINGLGIKTIDYEYEPITGLVTKVCYQKGASDQFIHKYTYNTVDQLVKVETSTDNSSFTLQAAYEYYETGAMRRTELAGGAQGIDYVYNLEGQLKSINHPNLNNTDDPGGDNNDLFGIQLSYHANDFSRNLPNIATSDYGTDQLNGNIKSMRWSNGNPNTVMSEYAYSYDRNNWLIAADFDPSGAAIGTGGAIADANSNAVYANGQSATLLAANSYTLTPDFHAQAGSTVTVGISANGGAISDGDYDVSNITYDANGNIQSLVRNKGSQDGGNAMDNLNYVYKADTPNQLLRVEDTEVNVANADDIEGQNGENYKYNAIGQLTRNNAEGIDYYYNASGLVTEVHQGGQPAVKFFYNDRNHRVRKESYTDGNLQYTTYYVRDVAGQVIAIYNDYSGSMALVEQPIYGSGRIGVSYVSSSADENRSYVYELTDHLGNVRAVFSVNSNTAQGDGYTDYYPGGMQMPGRNLVGDYRYGYQGQELDPETGKPAFELRLYDPRIMRWLTTDPAGQHASPYLAMGNDWVNKIDPDGGEDWYVNNGTGELEWHNTSGSIDGLTWVGTNSASHDYLSSIGKLFGGSGKINIADIAARSYYDITGGFNDGLGQRGKDFAAWLDSPVDRTLQGVANTINSTEQLYDDYVSSDSFGNLEGFLGNRIYDNVSSMTLYDWSYTAGYSTPDLALGIGLSYGGGALANLTFRGLGIAGRYVGGYGLYTLDSAISLRGMSMLHWSGGKIKFQIGLRNIKSNYHLRFERHKIGGKFNTHINYGTGGRHHWPRLKK